MHLALKDDGFFPEPGEIRGIIAQMEALHELIEVNNKVDQTQQQLSLLEII